MVKCLAFLTPRPRIIRLLVSKYVFVYLLNKNKRDNELVLGLTDLKYFIRLVPESAKLVEYEVGRVVGMAIKSNNQHLKLFAAETFLDFVVHDVSDIDALTSKCVRIISGRDDAMSTQEVITLLKEHYQLEE